MEDVTKRDMEEALSALASMISKSEKAQVKFAHGTSQHTLQRNRIHALTVAYSLIEDRLAGSLAENVRSKEDMEQTLKPLASLISKSEKAQAKFTEGAWQHTMLGDNLKALRMASSLLAESLTPTNPT